MLIEGLLVCIAVLLAALVAAVVYDLWQRRSLRRSGLLDAQPVQLMTQAIDGAVERLGEAVQHHTEVNAVLALMEQFTDRPELVRNLAPYSRQAVAAALTFRVNSLSEQHQVAMKQLAYQRKLQGQTTIMHAYDVIVEELSRLCDNLLEQLQEADRMVQEYGRLHPVS